MEFQRDAMVTPRRALNEKMRTEEKAFSTRCPARGSAFAKPRLVGSYVSA
jgi:hypothetical protein